MKTLTKLFIFLSVFQVNSQIAGESTYEFLNISSSPRQLALGGKEITLFDFDVNQPSINPASLNSRMNNNLAINFSNYFSLNFSWIRRPVFLSTWMHRSS